MKKFKITSCSIIIVLFIGLFNSTIYSQDLVKIKDSVSIVKNTSPKKIITEFDTISWSNEKIIIELPKIKFKHSSSYEEGFFDYFVIPSDSVTITIHCGAMVNLPLTDLKTCTLTGKFIVDKDVRILRGYSNLQNDRFKGKRYFREENYFKYGINIIYENVTEDKLSFYDNIFNNITIIRTEKNK